MNEKKEPTLSEILQMLTAGFSAIEAKMATKDDVAALEARLDGKIEGVKEELKTDIAGVRADVTSIKHDVADLKAGSFAKMEKEDLLARVKYIEDDLGIESGM